LFDTKSDAVDHGTARRKIRMMFNLRGKPALPWKSHPELATGVEGFGYSGFKRKFFFIRQPIHA
jgi:hypothetical protein